jgi:carboxysome shell carbonic anhydrase
MPRPAHTRFGAGPGPALGQGARLAESWQRRLSPSGQPAWSAGKPAWSAGQPGGNSVPAPFLPADTGRHPLADRTMSQALRHRAEEIDAAFDAIEPVLRGLAPHQFEPAFARRATSEILSQLRLDLPPELFAANWTAPLDMAALYARCVVGTYQRLIERGFDRSIAQTSDGESVDALVQHWGFHAVDITPCADGRLSGVIDYILRVPPSIVAYRQSYAGAMFQVAEAVQHWESTELRRWRTGQPNAADAPTRYLKMGVYHFSSLDPHHHGCAAHGNDGERAAGALLERLCQFAAAVRLLHGETAQVATLLVGVDTDTDAIRVHIPDSHGGMEVGRHLDSQMLYARTSDLPRQAAKDAIRTAVAASAGVDADDTATAGMRWFCGYLLKNNIAQVDAVREWHGGIYPQAGHRERLIVVGDAVDDVQLRNLAFQAQMATVEEGAADLDIGIHILTGLYEPQRLAVPVLVHLTADPRMPGAVSRAQCRARRLAGAIRLRYADLAARGLLHVQAVVRNGTGGALHPVDLAPSQPRDMETHA